MAKILIIGCGKIGYDLAIKLTHDGHAVTGLKRMPPEAEGFGIDFIRADIAVATDVAKLDVDFDFVYFIVSPDKRDEVSYARVYETGLMLLLSHFRQAKSHALWIFVSSTSVYGQTQGEWVDEDSETLPKTATAQLLLKAEQAVKVMNPANIIVRFSGIYGPGREYLLRQAMQRPVLQKTPPSYTNRIHQLDCVGILAFLLQQSLQGVQLESCYLANDDRPAPLWDVVSWLAEYLACPTPVEKALSHDSEQNKRCRNARIKRLGYRFFHPDYQSGYSEMIQLLNWP
ncbi:MAG: SDR family oxidoreductase [Gammaproteobacteria bacterium]|nr:SDR family oxidoreductase [Gammaproteobacteria bacterium]